MKANRLFLTVAPVLAALAIACGGSDAVDDSGSAPEPPGAVGGGLVAPDVFLTYEGQRFQLVNLLYGSLVEAGEFSRVGETAQADVDFSGSLAVYERAGHAGVLYTFEPQGQVWLQWTPAS